jgi:hypothetical protein
MEVSVTDLLIREVPDDVLAAIDGNAKRLGLSRTAYLRRALARESALSGRRVGREHLSRFTDLFADLDDPEIMRRAWG